MTKSNNEINRAYEAGRKVGKEHSEPSKETIKMIDDLKTSIEVNCTKMENIEKKVDEGFARVEKAIKEISDSKANKWVEKVMIGIGISIGTGLLGIIGWIIVEAIKRWQY